MKDVDIHLIYLDVENKNEEQLKHEMIDHALYFCEYKTGFLFFMKKDDYFADILKSYYVQLKRIEEIKIALKFNLMEQAYKESKE